MADPNKFKSVSVPIESTKLFLAAGKFVDELTISKTIEALLQEPQKN